MCIGLCKTSCYDLVAIPHSIFEAFSSHKYINEISIHTTHVSVFKKGSIVICRWNRKSWRYLSLDDLLSRSTNLLASMLGWAIQQSNEGVEGISMRLLVFLWCLPAFDKESVSICVIFCASPLIASTLPNNSGARRISMRSGNSRLTSTGFLCRCGHLCGQLID